MSNEFKGKIKKVPWQDLERLYYDDPDTECKDYRISDTFIYIEDIDLYQCELCEVFLKTMDNVIDHSLDKKHTSKIHEFSDDEDEDENKDKEKKDNFESIQCRRKLDTINEEDGNICLSCGS